MKSAGKRLLLAFASVLIAALLIYLFLPRNSGSYRAVPLQSTLVLEYDGLLRAKKMADNCSDPDWHAVLHSPMFVQAFGDAEKALRLFRHRPEIIKAFAQNKTLAALTLHPADSLRSLFIMEIGEACDLEEILKTNTLTQKYFPHQFHGSTIYNVHLSKTEQLEIASTGSLLLFSRRATLIEDALSQLEQTRNWWTDRPGPGQLPRAPLRMQLRPVALAEQWRNRMQPRWRDLPDLLARNVQWIGCSYDGNTCVVKTETTGFFAGIERWGTSPNAEIFNVLPQNTAFLIRTGIGNSPDFFREIGRFRSRDFEQYLLPWVGNEAALVVTAPASPALSGDRLLLFAVNDTALARRSLDEWGETRGLLPGLTGPYQMFDIWGFQDAGFLKPLLGDDEAFRNPVACLLEGFVLFAPDRSSIEVFLDKYLVGQTLSNHSDCLQLLQKMPKDGLAQCFVNTACQTALLNQLFLQNPFPDGVPHGPQHRMIAASIRPGHALVTDISVAGQSLLNAPGQTDILWKMPLMALVASPPKLIEQSAGKNYVLIQDVQNRLYCLDAQNGAIVWNKQFSGRILSDIQGIDFYGNGSKCYTFNTATQVFTLDEAGRDVQGFPLKLPAPATNGMLVVDFDKNTKFSYFVACENGRLYGLGHLGKALDGWNARPLSSKQQDAVARQPMVHFQHKGKDYLALLTEKGEFSVFGRDGSLRFPALQWDGIFKGPLSADATAATPRFYAANTSGKLFACDLQGNARTIQAGNSNTTAAFGQLTGDACYEWAVLEGKKAHIGAWEKPEGARLFSIEFPEKQHRVFFCPNRRIGSVDQRGRRVWLFNEKGQALPGFPLGGNTPFVLGEINGVEMLVAGNGNTVWAYRVRS